MKGGPACVCLESLALWKSTGGSNYEKILPPEGEKREHSQSPFLFAFFYYRIGLWITDTKA
jgi:hypothetical protein